MALSWGPCKASICASVKQLTAALDKRPMTSLSMPAIALGLSAWNCLSVQEPRSPTLAITALAPLNKMALSWGPCKALIWTTSNALTATSVKALAPSAVIPLMASVVRLLMIRASHIAILFFHIDAIWALVRLWKNSLLKVCNSKTLAQKAFGLSWLTWTVVNLPKNPIASRELLLKM